MSGIPGVDLRVEVCLDCGPLDTPTAWTDLSDRVISYDDSRGRAGIRDEMQPSTATIVFDCEDGQLDPMRAGSLVDFRAGRGLPGCPVRVQVRRRTSPTAWGPWRPLFRGYLAEDAWRVVRRREVVTSSVTVVDKVGMTAGQDSPESVWAAWAQYMGPDCWLRGAGGDTVTGAGGRMIDSSGHNRQLTIYGPSGGLGVFEAGSMMPGSSDGAMAMSPSMNVRESRTRTYTNLTMMCVWRAPSASTTLDVMGIGVGDGLRLRVAAPTNGSMVARIYSGAGAQMGAATVTRPSGTWLDNRAHVIVVRFDGPARRLDLWVDGVGATVSGSANVPASVTGYYRLGNAADSAWYDEWTVWDRTLSTLDCAVAQNIFLQAGAPWPGDSIGGRANRWLDLAQIPRDAWDNFQYHTGSGDLPLDSLRATKGNVGAELAALAESGLGALWTTREGRIRLRTRRALDNPDHHATYRQPVAHLTDEPEPSTGLLPVRRTHPVWSGARLESVVTASKFLWQNWITREIRNDAGVARYGVRRREWESLANSWTDPVQLAEIDLRDHEVPRVDVETITIDPQTDPAAVQLAVDTLELEQSIWLTWTDRAGLPWLVETAVQGMRWRWGRTRWLIELQLAPHPGTRPPAPWIALVRSGQPLHLWQIWETGPNPATVRDLAGAADGTRTSGALMTSGGPLRLAGLGTLLPVVQIPTADLSSVGDGPVTVEMAVGHTPNLAPHAGLAEYAPSSGAGFRIAIVSNVLKIWVGGREFTGPVWSDALPGNITFYGHLSVVMSPTGPVSVRIDGVEHPVTVSGSPGVSSWGGPGPVRVGSSAAAPAATAPTFMGGLAVFPGALTNRERDDHYRAAMQGVLPDPDAPQGYGVFTGGTVHDADGWRYHTFTESGTLGVVDPGLADVLVVDGGAAGAGGGGGGGMVWEQFEVMIPTSQPVTVGAGGAALQVSPEIVDAQPGGASSLGSLVVGGSAGQGGSADYEDILTADGHDGTTGGGGSGAGQPVGAGGAGAAGGDGGAGGSNATGGGGGAGGDGGAAGGGGDPYRAGDGGAGIQSTITGDWYGGGGGGGGSGAGGGAGGMGGGGKGLLGATAAEPGAPNTGGGGGGGGSSLAGREGGSGIVVVRTRIPT